MDNVQKHNICANVSSSQTFRSYINNGIKNYFEICKYSVIVSIFEQLVNSGLLDVIRTPHMSFMSVVGIKIKLSL
jgi:hypothetical protein